MKKLFKSSVIGAGLLFSSSFVFAQTLQQERLEGIETIRDVFNSVYAPKKWKMGANGVFINPIFNYDRRQVTRNPDLSLAKFQQEIQRSIQDIEDYHVGMRFNSSELSALPFNVVMVKNGLFPRYFVSHTLVDDLPVSLGDEIVSIDGVPVRRVIEQLWRQLGFQNHRLTDHRLLAQNFLFFRPRGSGLDVPQGNVSLGVIPKGKRKKELVDMTWAYQPDQTQAPESAPFQAAATLTSASVSNTSNRSVERLKSLEMLFDPQTVKEAELFTNDRIANNPYALGGRKSYTPILGDIITEAPEESPFYWYTFTGADGNTYGYLRLPSYSNGDLSSLADQFGRILNEMEIAADKLVLDQSHNPGGSVLYLYTLASMFSDKPLSVPLHQEVLSTFSEEALAQDIAFFESLDTDEAAKAALGDKLVGYEVTAKWMQDFAQYNRDLLQAVQTDKKLSPPLPLIGIPEIAPNNDYHFSKPVLLLTDALCFSGGDFFPAIMQDNNRMTVMGQITAGAGGYVNSMDVSTLPESLGVQRLSYTGSLAWRDSGFPIESIGVIPDVFYNPTARDINTSYQPYKQAILKQLFNL